MYKTGMDKVYMEVKDIHITDIKLSADYIDEIRIVSMLVFMPNLLDKVYDAIGDDIHEWYQSKFYGVT